jgi:hypothetical protein
LSFFIEFCRLSGKIQLKNSNNINIQGKLPIGNASVGENPSAKSCPPEIFFNKNSTE